MNTKPFDPIKKEQQLRQESSRWVTDQTIDAEDGDIPILDLSDYLLSPSKRSLHALAEQLKVACEEVGFFSIIGHQIASQTVSKAFEMTRRFHDLPLTTKQHVLMDKDDWPIGGVGYLPMNNKKLPARNTSNLNEAFLIKLDHNTGFDQNQWLDEQRLPGFKKAVINYTQAIQNLSKKMLPIFAKALDMPENYFEEAFKQPMCRLRMTHYPANKTGDTEGFGIAPHVDTTFCTLLAQNQPGLTIYSERKQQWINAPLIDGGFIVNSGELLKQWTNDRFLSTKHFANNNASEHSRYSIPFFLNANTDFVMSCIPSCCGPENPAKYPPISYAQSQAVTQGE